MSVLQARRLVHLAGSSKTLTLAFLRVCVSEVFPTLHIENLIELHTLMALT